MTRGRLAHTYRTDAAASPTDLNANRTTLRGQRERMQQDSGPHACESCMRGAPAADRSPKSDCIAAVLDAISESSDGVAMRTSAPTRAKGARFERSDASMRARISAVRGGAVPVGAGPGLPDASRGKKTVLQILACGEPEAAMAAERSSREERQGPGRWCGKGGCGGGSTSTRNRKQGNKARGGASTGAGTKGYRGCSGVVVERLP
jgi:hypothetical protein